MFAARLGKAGPLSPPLKNISHQFQSLGNRVNFAKLKNSCRKRWQSLYNFCIDLGKSRQPATLCADMPELVEIRERARERGVINEHLVPLFFAALQARPRLMVELGVGPADSTFVLSRVAQLTGARLVSVDINDRRHMCQLPGWLFVQEDDVTFGRRFPQWCLEQGLAPAIDFLFIDTSHLYEHTVQEIAAWFPHLADEALVVFHDTNLRPFFYRRDGSLGLGWDNRRGVIRAVEEYFGTTFKETEPFITLCRGWLIRHEPHCCGFTILKKMHLPPP